jgi:hypothetical protein
MVSERDQIRDPENAHGDDEPSDEKMYTSVPLEDDEGNTYVVQQQNVGPGSEAGGGEWPDPRTPPSTDDPAPA